jgi:hypothetical protein
MSTPVVFNGVTYSIPAYNDTGYAQGFGNLSTYLIALANISPINVTGSITGTGTVTPVATAASTFSTTVTGALTINGPTSGTDGQKITFRLLQDGTGHTVTFATGAGNFRFGTTITSFTASGANKTDYVGAIWNNAASRWDIVAVAQGF